MKSEFLTSHGKILLAIYSNEGCIVKEAVQVFLSAPSLKRDTTIYYY